MTLRLALVGGPMYDQLYRSFASRDVEIVVHADHPTLNAEVAARLARGERIDVLSTHSKYAPSQQAWLRTLDGLIGVGELAPRAVDLCRVDGALLCVPRNIDVRITWANARTLHGGQVPATWAALCDSNYAFGFPGRESGLFGTFFELVVAHGGALFDADGMPTIATDAARAAVAMMVALAARTPQIPKWHYDEVDAALGNGVVPIAAAWPGATTALRAAPEGRHLEPHPYLAGSAGVRSYSGCHAWAIPATCGAIDEARALVAELCGAEAHAIEAGHGAVCAHVGAFAAAAPVDELDRRRREILTATIAEGMITYPPMGRFPAIEDEGWRTLRRALRREVDGDAALDHIQRRAEEILA